MLLVSARRVIEPRSKDRPRQMSVFLSNSIGKISYCLHVTLKARLRPVADGLTPRAVLDKFATMRMLDVKFPTTDGRTLILSRYTEPDTDHKLLLEQLKLALPPQPPPRITAGGQRVH